MAEDGNTPDGNTPDGNTSEADKLAAAAIAASNADKDNVQLDADGKPIPAAEPDATGKTDAEIVAEAEATRIADEKTAQEAVDAKKTDDEKKADAAKEKAADEEAKKANLEAYGDLTGNQSMDDVTVILKEKGAKAEDVQALFKEAHETRDLSKVDQKKLVAMVGEESARMIMNTLTSGISDQDAAQNATIKMLYESAGNKETFDLAVEWMRAQKEGHYFDKLDEVRGLINGGGLGGEMATKALVAAFKSSGDFTETAKLITADPGSAAGSVDYIDQQTYIKALNDPSTTQAQIKLLDARRTKSLVMEADGSV